MATSTCHVESLAALVSAAAPELSDASKTSTWTLAPGMSQLKLVSLALTTVPGGPAVGVITKGGLLPAPAGIAAQLKLNPTIPAIAMILRMFRPPVCPGEFGAM